MHQYGSVPIFSKLIDKVLVEFNFIAYIRFGYLFTKINFPLFHVLLYDEQKQL